jgi:uncharacterized protein YraI
MRQKILVIGFFTILTLFVVASTRSNVSASAPMQEATQIATVTGTASGPVVTVRSDGEAFVNVRSGPSLFYDKIGVLLAGQQLPAKGKSSGGDWIQVEYQGVEGGVAWVYAPFVNLSPGTLPVVEPPATPTPRVTATIDPTLAAQFVVTAQATRLPTFTEPAPLVISTYEDSSTQSVLRTIPIGMIIVSFAALGILLMLFVLSLGR